MATIEKSPFISVPSGTKEMSEIPQTLIYTLHHFEQPDVLQSLWYGGSESVKTVNIAL